MPLVLSAAQLNAQHLAPILYTQFFALIPHNSSAVPAYESLNPARQQEILDFAQRVLDALLNTGILGAGDPAKETGGKCIEIISRKISTPDGDRDMLVSEMVHAIGREVMGWA